MLSTTVMCPHLLKPRAWLTFLTIRESRGRAALRWAGLAYHEFELYIARHSSRSLQKREHFLSHHLSIIVIMYSPLILYQR
mgnify:FL=1